MPEPRSGKERARSIPLDYYRRPDSLARWKGRLSLAACLVVLGGLALGRDWRGSAGIGEATGSRLMASRGPLAAPHAAWDAQCERCHVPFQAIGSISWSGSLGIAQRTGNDRCIACHAGPAHHPNERPADIPACADCHKDHRGREALITQVDDNTCTSCHADLLNHRKPDAPQLTGLERRARITRFDLDHPDFAPLEAQDPGRVRFNHALHLTPGLPSAAGGKPLWTVGMLAAEDRSRYAREGRKDADGVVLDCASCHESPESSDARGAYFPPVSFERHCAACHRLQTPGPEGAMIAVPHGIEPAAVRQSLRERILGVLLQSDPELKPQQGRPRPDRRPRKEIEEALRRKVDQGVAVSERLLYEGAKAVCTECHFYRTVAGDTVDQPSPDDLAALDRLRIEPAGIPLVWYPRARFDHQPHRAVECRQCHEQAHPDSPRASRTHLDVQLPTKESCVPCHAPAGGTAEAPRGGVAHSCVTCHRYHAVESPSEIEPAVPRRGLDALLGRSPHPEPENRKTNSP